MDDDVRAGLRRFNSARRVPLLLCDAKGTAIPLSISWITPAELIAAACWFYSNRFLESPLYVHSVELIRKPLFDKKLQIKGNLRFLGCYFCIDYNITKLEPTERRKVDIFDQM